MQALEARSYLVPFERLPRPVFWFNDDFPPDTWSKPHVHRDWGELAYTGSGCMVMCTEQGNFLAPPQRAVWVPPGLPHEWYVPCEAWDRSLYIEPFAVASDARFGHCHVMEISPLVRELILHLAVLPYPYGDDDAAGRLVGVLLDLLPTMPEIPAPLAMPRDHRLVELCTALLAAPGTTTGLPEWAERLGMSERNLARLFRKETGMSFRSWRLRRRMEAARTRLERGESVTAVALDSGYSSVSAFIETFKGAFGSTPGCFVGAQTRQA